MSRKRIYNRVMDDSKQNGTALLKRMHDLSRCGEKRYSWNSIKRSGF